MKGVSNLPTTTTEHTSLPFPKIIFGTSILGNLYQVLPHDQQLAIVKACMQSQKPVVFDSAGKYGAGLALENLGHCLKELNVKPEEVIISNKLGWMRMPLTTAEPTFEAGVWKDLKYDAFQNISYDGIMQCFEQGNELLQGYMPQYLSVHDPDEYIAAATDEGDLEKRYHDILEAYRALHDLKMQGRAKAIGVGAKDWRTIQRIAADVDLDWVMFANSLTIYNHPQELLDFVAELDSRDVQVINSAVFHGGFLIGSEYFNYRLTSRDDANDKALYVWRDQFNEICERHHVLPAQACVRFAFTVPGVQSVALNSSSPKRTAQNIEMTHAEIPASFWKEMKSKGLISKDYPYL
jgi:D-threo-aldose 1-dehydrogenase